MLLNWRIIQGDQNRKFDDVFEPPSLSYESEQAFVFVDFTKIKTYEGLDRFVRRSMSRLNVDIAARTVLTSHRCLFIVDKVKLGDSLGLEALQRLIKANTNAQHSWVILVNYDDLHVDEKIKELF